MRGVREVGGREDGRGQRDRSNRWRTRFERENQAERQKQRELEDGDKQIDQRIYKDLKGESLRCERHMRKGKEQRRGQGGRGEEGKRGGVPPRGEVSPGREKGGVEDWKAEKHLPPGCGGTGVGNRVDTCERAHARAHARVRSE
jgi:hypothetical protein